jgi:hypothetical protein
MSNKTKREYKLVKTPEIGIGKLVFKPSGKPFKSGLKHNTVKELVTNPNTGKIAYSFNEDNSIVDVHQCELVEAVETIETIGETL